MSENSPKEGHLPVLVMGATRGTGREIVTRLRRDGYPVRALARSAANARRSLPADIEIVEGDITKPETLRAAIAGSAHVILTVGVPMGPASQRSIITVEYDGVRNTLSAASAAGFAGRFLYMTTIGVTRHSIGSIFLDLVKGRTVTWRRRAEEAIRASGIDYTIVRCGVLTNGPADRAVELSQEDHRLSIFRRISRDAAAEVFVQALRHPSSSRATFDASWAPRGRRETWDELFARLRPDAARLPR